MQTIILTLHLVIALLLIGLILMQRGRGADIGAAFGSGASQTLFGSHGSTSFLVKLVSVLIAVFFISSLALNYLIADNLKQQQLANTPAVLLQKNAVKKTNA